MLIQIVVEFLAGGPGGLKFHVLPGKVVGQVPGKHMFLGHRYRTGVLSPDNRFFDAGVAFRFPGNHETRSHVNAVCPQRQGGQHTARVSDAAAGDHGNADRIRDHGRQHQGGQLGESFVAAGFKTLADNRIHAGFLGFFAMPGSGNRMQHLDAGVFEYPGVCVGSADGDNRRRDRLFDDNLDHFLGVFEGFSKAGHDIDGKGCIGALPDFF